MVSWYGKMVTDVYGAATEEYGGVAELDIKGNYEW
jgi:hypothetical protein